MAAPRSFNDVVNAWESYLRRTQPQITPYRQGLTIKTGRSQLALQRGVATPARRSVRQR